jgi:OsmC-like protein
MAATLRHVGEPTYPVVVSSGSLRPQFGNTLVMPHRWTPGGVVVEADFTGAHLLHLAAAGCVLNDIYREAGRLAIGIDGVWVRASGGFDAETWASTGIEYDVEVASPAGDAAIEQLLRVVDDVAEIPRALRAGPTVVRRGTR